MTIQDGSNVRRKADGSNGPVGKVTATGAETAGLVMNNSEWTPTTVFVVWRGDDMGWYGISELEETNDPCPYLDE